MPEFQDGWPDIYLAGYHVVRSSSYLMTHEEQDQGVVWRLLPGTSSDGPSFVIVGDLTIRTASRFAGVQVIAGLEMRDGVRVEDGDWVRANELLVRHAGWVTHGMYDVAALAMRALPGPGALPVPTFTPPHEIVTAAADEEGAHQDIVLPNADGSESDD